MFNSISSEKLQVDTVGSHYGLSNTTVYVIDDDTQIRRSLHYLLSTVGITIWPFATAADFLDSLATLEPAPILLDIRMPEMDGIQLMNMLLERGHGWPIIVMTAHGEIPIAVQAIKLGAIEFLEKPFEFEALDISLHAAFAQLSKIKAATVNRDSARHLFELLSARETDVVKFLLQGFPNKVTAHMLSLSVRTIEMHRANALAKLNVKSLAEVVRLSSDAKLDLSLPAKDGEIVNS